MRTLDVKRLGKQRVEVIQIVRALTVPGYAWANHPAVLMWKGFEEALGRYGLLACTLWTAHGFGDTCADTIRADLAAAGITGIRSWPELDAAGALPGWLGDETLHRSHRSALLGKDPHHYGPLFPADTPADLPYHWPVRSPAVVEREAKRAARAAARAEGQATPGTPTAGPRPTARKGAGAGPGRRNRSDPGGQPSSRS
ncbi:hypothetical protein FHX74_000609 [Friedmanniella endophytica]|uniref:Cytoplasmic protein n=1 Tax=Microlunatus kandeliicorticis TaxID=1759536 RepID=A0A7W3IPV1_9ACTN|nr:hypothetical protein [Microlunatus kandeliicorticis]